jgi:hypothetical protein
MSAPDRAARIADARTLLDILEADESLPLPGELKHLGFYFRADGPTPAGARRQLAVLESAIPAAFEAGHADPDGSEWIVDGVMPGGVKVKLRAWTRHVAEEVTTTRQAEVTEWVRLPVQDEAPESGEQA